MMMAKVLLFLWISLLNNGKVFPHIAVGGHYRFFAHIVPIEGNMSLCGKAYIDVWRRNFSCALGSIEYCSIGKPEDITRVGSSVTQCITIGP